MTADSKGGITLSAEMMKALGCKIGDPYAIWEEGDELRLVFTKTGQFKGKIPKAAKKSKVEPALPEKN